MIRFTDRRDAGRQLADVLGPFADGAGTLVLGLPRGGVPVAYEVAMALGALLDVLVVRKLGAPGHEELAMGAIASGGIVVLNQDVIDGLHVSADDLKRVTAMERAELARRELQFRGALPPLSVVGRTVILVDDGMATGATMAAAIAGLRTLKPRAIVVAVPVASSQAAAAIARQADRCICLETPEPFYGVGQWYVDFDQTSDVEVRRLLDSARHRRIEPTAGVAQTIPGAPS